MWKNEKMCIRDRVIDEFDYFAHSKYFDDHCHLNQAGYLYTERLNQVITLKQI